MEPTGFEAWAGLPPSEQAAHQVRAILQTIAADAGDIGEDRFCRVDYGQLCAEPHAVLGSLGDFFRASGGPVERREGASIPGTFARPASAGLEAGA